MGSDVLYFMLRQVWRCRTPFLECLCPAFQGDVAIGIVRQDDHVDGSDVEPEQQA